MTENLEYKKTQDDWALTPPPELEERVISYVMTERTPLWEELLSSEKAGNNLGAIAPPLIRAIKDVYPSVTSVQLPTLLLRLRNKAVETLINKGPSA